MNKQKQNIERVEKTTKVDINKLYEKRHRYVSEVDKWRRKQELREYEKYIGLNLNELEEYQNSYLYGEEDIKQFIEIEKKYKSHIGGKINKAISNESRTKNEIMNEIQHMERIQRDNEMNIENLKKELKSISGYTTCPHCSKPVIIKNSYLVALDDIPDGREEQIKKEIKILESKNLISQIKNLKNIQIFYDILHTDDVPAILVAEYRNLEKNYLRYDRDSIEKQIKLKEYHPYKNLDVLKIREYKTLINVKDVSIELDDINQKIIEGEENNKRYEKYQQYINQMEQINKSISMIKLYDVNENRLEDIDIEIIKGEENNKKYERYQNYLSHTEQINKSISMIKLYDVNENRLEEIDIEICKGEENNKRYEKYQQYLNEMKQINKSISLIKLYNVDEQRIEEIDEEIKNIKLIEETNNNVRNIEKRNQIIKQTYNEKNRIVKEKKHFDEEEERYNKIKYQVEMLQNIKTIISDGISKSIEDKLNQLSTITDHYIAQFFDYPINIDISPYKDMKTRGEKKNEINIKLSLRGRECNITSLSGGELSRVSLAITLAINRLMPVKYRMLIMDESMSGLDEENREKCIEIINKRCQITGITSINVLHGCTEGMFDNIINL